jgi:hypothetical protein
MVPLSYSSNSSNAILSAKEVGVIFSDVQVIFNLAKTMLKDLQERLANWSETQKIADIFLNLVGYSIVL